MGLRSGFYAPCNYTFYQDLKNAFYTTGTQ